MIYYWGKKLKIKFYILETDKIVNKKIDLISRA